MDLEQQGSFNSSSVDKSQRLVKLANLFRDVCTEVYVSIPDIYGEQVAELLSGSSSSPLNDDCHISLYLDGLTHHFNEIDIYDDRAELAAAELTAHNIPFKMSIFIAENMHIEIAYLLNAESLDGPVRSTSSDQMIFPEKGKLMKRAKDAKKFIALVEPDVKTINEVMRQQEPLFKLTGTIDTLTEFKFQKPKE